MRWGSDLPQLSEPSGAISLDPLPYALRLLQTLNTAAIGGVPLRIRCGLEGFEPWWFSQEIVFWRMLVPFADRRKGILPAPTGPPPAAAAGRLSGAVAFARLALSSLAAILSARLLQRDTLFYAIDQLSPGLDHDFRLSGLYAAMRRRGYRFVEILHGTDLRRSVRLLRERGRTAVYLPVLDRLFPAKPPTSIRVEAIDFDGDLDDEERRLLGGVAQWCLGAAASARRKTQCLRVLLRLAGIRRAIVLDDSRHANELIAACKLESVPVLGYMHGLLNRYHVGLTAPGFRDGRPHTFDRYGLWSEYFARRVAEGDLYRGTDAIRVTGPLRPYGRGEVCPRRRTSAPSSRTRVLLVSEPRARQGEVREYLRCLAGDNRLEVRLRMRPGEERAGVMADGPVPGVELCHAATLAEAMADSDVVLGSYSTVLYEAAALLKPTVLLGTSFTYGLDLATDGLSDLASRPEHVVEVVLRAAGLDNAELERRRHAIWGDWTADGPNQLLDLAETDLWAAPEAPR